MKTAAKVAMGSIFAIALTTSALIVHAGNWDNFKLRYAFLTQHFSNRERELADLRKQTLSLATGKGVVW